MMKDLYISDDDDWTAVLQELESMFPGKSVVYGWYIPDRRQPMQVQPLLRDQLRVLRDANRIMCFHMRLQPPVYFRERTALVAYGVAPGIKLRLEAALERFVIPKPVKV